MDKKEFKASVLYLLNQEVNGLAPDKKIRYIKKWIREYEQTQMDTQEEPTVTNKVVPFHLERNMKIGLLVRTTINRMASSQVITSDKLKLLLDERYCKNTFDINYPFLLKVNRGEPLSEQRKINGYDRYWAEPVMIHHERYLICNDWYEKNRSKFVRWVEYMI